MRVVWLVALTVTSVAAEPSFTVDSTYGLAIIVAGIPKGTAGTITWQRSDGVGPRVSQDFAAGTDARLLRFSPKKEYKFQVQDSAGNTIGTQEYYTCTAGATGVDQYDADQPFVHFSGRPTFEMVVVDHGAGLVGINADGWIVWYLPGGNGAWDQLPAEFNYDIVTMSGFGTLAAAGFLELTSTGKKVANVSYNGISHEARVDPLTHDVLSVGSETRNVSISGVQHKIQGSTIVRWSRENGTVDTLYNLFDYYDPVTDYGQCSGRKDSAACRPPSGRIDHFPPSGEGEDWTHGNSVERGTRNNYIMSVRHLSTVISFHADGSGIQWVLSGEGVKPSKDPKAVVLEYSALRDHQYMEHCARQLSNGNVILFDNGDLRQPPFTRFSEYEIDADQGTAKLVWQFVPMLNATEKMFAFHAGSVERLANGNTVGSLSCDNSLVGNNCTHAIFEANSKGEEIARAFVPRAVAVGGARGSGYRGLPLLTLGGEREVTNADPAIIV